MNHHNKHMGSTLGDNAQARFDPVTAQFVRINILQSSDGPTLWDFKLMEK